MTELMELSGDQSKMNTMIDRANEVATKAQLILNLLGASLKKTDNAGSVAIISEDQIPGGLDGNLDALESLRADGYVVGWPKNQRNLSRDYPECRGRTLQLLATSDGKLLKH